MNTLSTCLAFISFPGGAEWIVIAILGLLIFGKRLPEVGKSLGKSIVEFKKGLKGIETDIDKAVDQDQADMLPPPANADGKPEASSPRSNSNAEDNVSHVS